jgi:serine/threonine protein phosphatase PrpC
MAADSSAAVRPPTTWRLLSVSVLGPSHEKSGLANQDAVGALAIPPGSSEVRLVAVSDGHGDSAHFRSERGSSLAVRAALETSRHFVTSTPFAHADAVRQWADEVQAQRVVGRWRDLVADDLTAWPFTSTELESLKASDGDARARSLALNPVRAYGATLVGVTVTADCIVYCQVGDGDIVTVSAAGHVSQPLEDEAHPFSNMTSSLCDADPLRSWRASVQEQSRHQTALVLLASDGYSGAFEDKASFLNTVQALAEVLRSGGEDKLRATLDQSVAKARTFTGDDTTVAVLYRAPESAP